MNGNDKNPPQDNLSPTHNIIHDEFVLYRKLLVNGYASDYCKNLRIEKCPVKIKIND